MLHVFSGSPRGGEVVVLPPIPDIGLKKPKDPIYDFSIFLIKNTGCLKIKIAF